MPVFIRGLGSNLSAALCRKWADCGLLSQWRRGYAKALPQSGDSVILLPENPAYEPRIVSMQDFETGEAAIIGVAIQVLRNL